LLVEHVSNLSGYLVIPSAHGPAAGKDRPDGCRMTGMTTPCTGVQIRYVWRQFQARNPGRIPAK